MNKIKTGIRGFDELIQGGFNPGTSILLSGTPGTGKTIFALEYLYRGAMKGENGLLISFEEPIRNLKNQAKQFGWDFDKLEKEGKLTIMYVPSSWISKPIIDDVIKTVNECNIKRLALDSVSTLALSIPTIHTKVTEVTNFAIKRFVHTFIEQLRKLKETTTLLIAQTLDDKSFSNDQVSEFLSDGIIHINYESLGGDYSRSLIVRKMRQCKNNEDIHPLEITDKGLVIHSLDQAM